NGASDRIIQSCDRLQVCDIGSVNLHVGLEKRCLGEQTPGERTVSRHCYDCVLPMEFGLRDCNFFWPINEVGRQRVPMNETSIACMVGSRLWKRSFEPFGEMCCEIGSVEMPYDGWRPKLA